MAAQEWKTVSVRLNEQEENALNILCNKKGETKHEILKKLLLNKLGPILNPGSISEDEGIPLLGEHIFKYQPNSDVFTWQIDFGAQGTYVLGEDIPVSFLENIRKAVHKGLKEREDLEKKITRKKTRVPKSIIKYAVKKNA